ncbi:MAG: hypothetical protein AAF563_12445 [Pseudomonadota bacterium]
MALPASLVTAWPYIAAGLELIQWTVGFVGRAGRGEMTEEEMIAEWEARVRTDVREANRLWQAAKDRDGQDQTVSDPTDGDA